MKKQKILVMVCLVGLWVVSCVKENDVINTNVRKIDKSATAQLLKHLKTNGFEGAYLMMFPVGHNISVCGGKCINTGNGKTHRNCMYYGNECRGKSSVNIIKNIPDDITDIYYTATSNYENEPTEDSVFYMPARSLYIENDTYENGFIWLNIPEQVLRRNEENNLFIYNEISFTSNPLFDNL